MYDFLQQHDVNVSVIRVHDSGDVVFETHSRTLFTVALKNNVYETTRALYMALVEVPRANKKYKRELITHFDVRDTNAIQYSY